MNLCEYGANMRIRVGYVRYAKVILPQMRFRRANMVRMCENLEENTCNPTPNMRVVPPLDSRVGRGSICILDSGFWILDSKLPWASLGRDGRSVFCILYSGFWILSSLANFLGLE